MFDENQIDDLSSNILASFTWLIQDSFNEQTVDKNQRNLLKITCFNITFSGHTSLNTGTHQPASDAQPTVARLGVSALLIHMTVFMSFHLRQSQHCIVTLSAVVMSLLPIVTAARGGAELSWSELLEASSQNTVQLLMLSSMSHHLVCVCTVIVTLQTVEMTRTLLISTCKMAILK